MKKILFILLGLIVYGFAFGQSPKLKISGTAVDTVGAPLEYASALLLSPADSSLLEFTQTDSKGYFEFKNIKRQELLIKVTYVGLLPYQEKIELNDGGDIKLEPITLKPISKELYEVVVKTAKAPISISGDTIEYDASKFKVPPGSSVEDLLKKLPGVQIDQDGNIVAQGENVQKVTVDGKRFFGGDAKMATKNLQADVISKVQIFNDKSEQSKATGIDDGKKEKTVNLELKEDAKKGAFGKINGGLGTFNRASASANYNRFDKVNQFSLIGFGNNLNVSSISFDDYRDFRGSNSFNWSDQADFGFGNTSYFRSFYSDDDGISIPIGGREGQGFTNNYAGGINYNFNQKKKEVSASYYYSLTKLRLNGNQVRENFLTNQETFVSTDSSRQKNEVGNHRFSLRASVELDSSNSITYIGNARVGDRTSNLLSYQEFFKNENFLSNTSDQDNSNSNNSYAILNTFIYRHKFNKKKGRNFAFSANQQSSHNSQEAQQQSLNEFFSATDAQSFIKSIYLINSSNNKANVFKGNLMYLEPFKKRFYWETFFNYNLNLGEENKSVFDQSAEALNSDLSGFFDNKINYSRLGTSFRYSYKGLNTSIGIAGVKNTIEANFYESKKENLRSSIQKEYNYFTPNFSFDYQLKNNKFIGVDYTVSVDAPNIGQLSPIINNANPLYITQGNPNLEPTVENSIRGRFNTYNPVKFVHFYLGLNARSYKNQIVYSQQVDEETLITNTKPINISGGTGYGGYMGFGFPIIKTKLTVNLSSSLNSSKNLAYVNDNLNETNSLSFNGQIRIGLTPIDWFTFYGSASFGTGDTKYSINTTQNQKIINNNFNGEMNLKFPKDFFWSTKLDYRIYKNDRYNFNQNIPLLNSSVYKQFGKQKKLEARITAYDILKKNRGISQSASANFVSIREVQTLSRYFMFSLTYNMRGNSSEIKKRHF